MGTLTGYRLAILMMAARPDGQAADAYGTCEAARGAASWLQRTGYIEARDCEECAEAGLPCPEGAPRWYATTAGRAALARDLAGGGR